MKRFSRASMRVLALLLLAGCGADGGTGPGQVERGIGATVLLYAQTGNDAIVEAEILLDGAKKGATQRVVNGTFQYWLTFEEPLKNAGRHRVGIRIVDQKYPVVEYLISGAAYGVNARTQATNQVSFPTASYTLREGDVVEVTVDVP